MPEPKYDMQHEFLARLSPTVQALVQSLEAKTGLEVTVEVSSDRARNLACTVDEAGAMLKTYSVDYFPDGGVFHELRHIEQQTWDASALRSRPQLLRDAPVDEETLELPLAPEGEEIVFDYAATGLTLRRHPLALLRPLLKERRLRSAEELQDVENGRHVRYCGIVTLRQQPDTAGGTIFLSLEDETGVVQVVCWKRIRETQRAPLLQSRLLAVYGTWQSEGELRSLIAERLEDMTPLLGRLSTDSRDFR